jgi:CRISPR-associated protein Cas2
MLYSYIVAYDVSSPKRLRRVRKTLLRYGDPVELSIFECQLNDALVVTLKARLREIIHHALDQVLFIRLGPVEGRSADAIESLGRRYRPPNRRTLII